MKSQLILCVLVSAFIMLTSCGKSNSIGPDPDPDPNPDPNVVSEDIGPDGGEITSADGLLTLTIPAGALGNAETITITPIEADDLGSEFDDIEVENAYEFGPDGLEFDMPVTATFVTEQNPIAGPDSVEFVTEFLLTSENGQVNELDTLQTVAVLDNSEVAVSGVLTHFAPLVRTLRQYKTGATGKFTFSGLPSEVFASPDTITAILTAKANLEPVNEEPFDLTFVTFDQETENPLEAVSPGEGLTGLPVSDFFQKDLSYRCPQGGTGFLGIYLEFGDENVSPTRTLRGSVTDSIHCLLDPTQLTFNLEVAVQGDGSGSISSNPAGIACPDDCEEDYEEGTEVTLTATSTDSIEGSVFSGWSGGLGDTPTIQLTMDQARSVTATFNLEQDNGGLLQIGLFPLPDLTKPETAVLIGGPEQAFANFPTGSVPALVQGAEGFIVLDLVSKEVLLDFTNVLGNNTTATGLRTPLGALAVSRPNPGPDTPSVIASYGQDNNNTEFGFSLYPYDTQTNEYIKGPVSPYPSTVDAFPVGGKSISDEVIIVREGGFGINFLRYNSVSDEYLFRPSNETLVSARYGFEQPVTAYGEFVDGPLLVVNIKGDLYFEPRNRLINSPSVLIGNLGERIIRIRCELPVCVATDFEGNTVRIITWDGETAPSIVGNPVSVGSGPVDPDLYTLSDGRILIKVTGFDDNTISLLVVDSGGNILANTLYEAPQGCVNPGHVIIEDNPDDAENPLIIGSCYETANYFVNDLLNTGELFTVISEL